MQRICSLSSRTALSIGVAALALLQGCASGPPPKRVSVEEQIRQDVAVGSQMAETFETKLRIKKDPEVSVYLRGLGQKLTGQVPELKAAPLGVLVVEDRGGKWFDYSLPGNRVYLSVGWLKGTEFENEVAAAIAVELAHIVKRHAVIRLTHDPEIARLEGSVIESVMPVAAPDSGRVNVDFFGPKGIFAFTQENRLDATEMAVDILYKAGFDPRGLIAFWSNHLAHPESSPFDSDLIQRLIERARAEIAERSPLRNPIVRSKEFLAVKKRIGRL